MKKNKRGACCLCERHYQLHNHTTSSNERLIDSINKPAKLIQYAFDLGLAGIAITDHETINAHVKCLNYVEAQRNNKKLSDEERERWKNFKLILGNEIYLCRNGLNSETYNPKQDKFYHFILLAKDEEGHHQIRQLSTRAYQHSFMRSKMRRVPTWYKDVEEIIGNNKGHIISSSACLGGYLGTKLLAASRLEKKEPEAFAAEIEKIKNWVNYIQDLFGDGNFFLELQPSENQEQIYVNNWLLKISNELNIKAIITTDSHYLKKEDRFIHKAFLNSKDGEREVDEFYASAYLMSAQEIHEYLDKTIGDNVVEECLANTCLIGDKIKEYSLKRNFKLPYLPSNEDKEKANNHITLPDGYTFKNEYWDYFINSDEPANRVFIQRIIEKCESNPELFLTKESIDEIEIELKSVIDSSEKQKMIWSKYFLQVADYINIIWNEGDSLVCPGRGSGVGFYLNYLLDITQVNPLLEEVSTKYWRFLNPERASILD